MAIAILRASQNTPDSLAHPACPVGSHKDDRGPFSSQRVFPAWLPRFPLPGGKLGQVAKPVASPLARRPLAGSERGRHWEPLAAIRLLATGWRGDFPIVRFWEERCRAGASH